MDDAEYREAYRAGWDAALNNAVPVVTVPEEIHERLTLRFQHLGIALDRMVHRYSGRPARRAWVRSRAVATEVDRLLTDAGIACGGRLMTEEQMAVDPRRGHDRSIS